MTELQKKDLLLLEELCTGKKKRFTDRFLGLSDFQLSLFQREGDWKKKLANYWAFPADSAFTDCLDITLRTFTRFALDANGKKIPILNKDGVQMKDANGKPAYSKIITQKWVQGGNFSIPANCLFWNDVMGYRGVWKPYPGLIGLQVFEARPVVPASKEADRDPGKVKASVYRYTNGKMSPCGQFTTTQDGMIRVLITGDIPALETRREGDFSQKTN